MRPHCRLEDASRPYGHSNTPLLHRNRYVGMYVVGRNDSVLSACNYVQTVAWSRGHNPSTPNVQYWTQAGATRYRGSYSREYRPSVGLYCRYVLCWLRSPRMYVCRYCTVCLYCMVCMYGMPWCSDSSLCTVILALLFYTLYPLRMYYELSRSPPANQWWWWLSCHGSALLTLTRACVYVSPVLS